VGLNIDTPWTAAANVVNGLIDRFVPNPAEAAKEKADASAQLAAQALAVLQASVTVDVAQAATNTAEAQSSNRWDSGWRPAAGWTCVGGLFYAVLAQPLLSWLAYNLARWTAAPVVNIEILVTLLFALLGVSTQRTIERLNGKIPPQVPK
jgi:hypothetical protein